MPHDVTARIGRTMRGLAAAVGAVVEMTFPRDTPAVRHPRDKVGEAVAIVNRMRGQR